MIPTLVVKLKNGHINAIHTTVPRIKVLIISEELTKGELLVSVNTSVVNTQEEIDALFNKTTAQICNNDDRNNG